MQDLTEIEINFRNLTAKYLELKDAYEMLQDAYSDLVNCSGRTMMQNIKLQQKMMKRLNEDCIDHW